jgi:hypothetical protein
VKLPLWQFLLLQVLQYDAGHNRVFQCLREFVEWTGAASDDDVPFRVRNGSRNGPFLPTWPSGNLVLDPRENIPKDDGHDSEDMDSS